MIQELLEGLAQLLDEHGVALYKPKGGGSIFLEGIPERAEHAIGLTVYGASDTGFFPDDEARPRLQVMVRGDRDSPRWSRERSEAANRVLNGFQGHLSTGVDVHLIWAVQPVAASLGPDAGGRWSHSQNYEVWCCMPVPIETEAHDARDHHSPGRLSPARGQERAAVGRAQPG